MALVHQSVLTPTKLELLGAWLPTRGWFAGGSELTKVGSYRFDDPVGEVGIECMLVESGGITFHVPLSYRGQPLEPASEHLIGTLHHSVLGERWVYDGTADPTVVNALVSAAIEGGTEATVEVEIGGQMVTLPPEVRVNGSGSVTSSVGVVGPLSCLDENDVTTIVSARHHIRVARVVGTGIDGQYLLSGSWLGGGPVALVAVDPRPA